VSGQLIAMRVRMGGMLWRECCLFDGFMLWMREGMVKRMVLIIFQVALPVFAGPSFDRGFCLAVLRLMRISRCHNQ